MAPSVQAFGDFLDDLCRKGLQIAGLRDVITPWSTTTAESCHLAPALITSVLIE
jgi:hypothetical protein